MWNLDPRCDQPGCDALATHIDRAEAPNTGVKVWYSCDVHRPVPMAKEDT
jgi:hypothetical protein